MKNLMKSVSSAFSRCKKWIISIFIIYCFSCLTGILMVHLNNSFAFSYRDKIAGQALKNDKASINYLTGNRFKAALFDFSGNLFAGSCVQTFLGFSIVLPYFTTFYQGWVGGIVSVDSNHVSRLDKLKSALYYFIVLLLQFIPYSLTIGSGIKAGVETYKSNKKKTLSGYTIDKQSLYDVLKIYVIATPLFFIASCFEFLSPWN
jgi:hypothetical protein